MEKIYIAAGGTGGHINAALALGEKYKNEFEVQYITGTRYLDYQLFKDKKVIHVDSKPLRVKNPLVLILNIIKNLFVFIKLLRMFIRNKPKFLVGAGGYVCGPSLLAGWLLGRTIFIIEQNATLGLTNKLLAKISKKIFVHFEKTRGLENTSKVILAGNPIRGNIKFSKQVINEERINVLVYGGSLGARQINQAISLFANENTKYNFRHQVGKSNKTIEKDTENYQQVEYIDDMQEAYDWANVIIARGGASTVAELRVVGKPAIIIPFPGHADNHQVYNAEELKRVAPFSVIIINNKLVKEELKNEIYKRLEEIIFKSNDNQKIIIDSSFEIIDKEIKDVWNK